MMTTTLRAALVACVALSIAGCNGDDVTGPKPLSAFIVTPGMLTLIPNDTISLRARYQEPNGTLSGPVDGSWSSLDQNIASVSSTGLLTAKAIGTVQIRVSQNGRMAYATVSVQEPVVSHLSISPQQIAMTAGTSMPLEVSVYNFVNQKVNGRLVTFSSSNTTVLTVNESGVLSAAAEGVSVVTATSEGKTASVSVSVTRRPAASLAITPSALSIPRHDQHQLSVHATDAQGHVSPVTGMTFASLDNGVVTVSATGMVTALNMGVGRIVATLDGKSDTATVTVTVPALAAIYFPYVGGPIARYDSVQVTGLGVDKAGQVLADKVVSYTSSDNSKLTVDSAGWVRAISEGIAVITASVEGKSASVTYSIVGPRAVTVQLQQTSFSLIEGDTARLVPVGYDRMGNVVVGQSFGFHSSRPELASIDQTGLIKALKNDGTAFTVMAFVPVANGAGAGASVTVSAAPVASIGITPPAATISLGSRIRLNAIAYDLNGSAVPGAALTWATSDATVAAVDATGNVTASSTKKGVVTITATASNGKFASAAVTVID